MKELQLAKQAASAAAKLIQQYSSKDFRIKKKGEIDLVTEVDEKAQSLIIETIKKSFPNDSILAEEGEYSSTARAERLWIIDPIDGTTNFAHGYPCYCVSIAFEEKGKISAGVIHDPNRDEVFSAELGAGAYLGEEKISVSPETNLKQALLVTGFPYDLHNPETDNFPIFQKLMFEAQAIRRDGSAALNLAYTACGRFDAFWELGLKPWDMAAGILILQEAGGLVLPAPKIAPDDPYPEAFVAGNPELSRQIHAYLP